MEEKSGLYLYPVHSIHSLHSIHSIYTAYTAYTAYTQHTQHTQHTQPMFQNTQQTQPMWGINTDLMSPIHIAVVIHGGLGWDAGWRWLFVGVCACKWYCQKGNFIVIFMQMFVWLCDYLCCDDGWISAGWCRVTAGWCRVAMHSALLLRVTMHSALFVFVFRVVSAVSVVSVRD